MMACCIVPLTALTGLSNNNCVLHQLYRFHFTSYFLLYTLIAAVG